MQIKKISDMPMINIIPNREPLSPEELQREYDYIKSVKIIQKMLDKNLITQEEFNKIDHLNRKSFSPLYSRLMP
ncbi:SHOCT domain-containing protein [Anaerocolumna sp. MB42-C2]|uniref:SHOCT domain-containing protein n=1 Tax=Anaerocolumna sp. MB42-C2 TaxID=3070997 RepID=UPI0027DEF8F6|nr:SHOCT domain-containing protein [Anaerocolumna sp. MB42-C2]WMJ86776.1 hypothetical protein RBU59_22460 [Anaerocolumna sp. MB42-C2]